MFKLESKYKPSGDQPQAIEKLVKGIENGENTRFYLAQRVQEKLLQLQMLLKKYRNLHSF